MKIRRLFFLLIIIQGCNNTNLIKESITEIKNNNSFTNSYKLDNKKVIKVEISKNNLNLQVNQQESLSALVKVESGEINSAVEWVSSDPSIANISSSGKVNALKRGVVLIKAIALQDQRIFAECLVNVFDYDIEEPILLEINSSNSNYVLKENTTLKLNGFVKYLNGNFDKDINWLSLDNSVATVNSEGLVTGIRSGVVTIRAISKKNINIKSEIRLNVFPVFPEVKPSFSIIPSSIPENSSTDFLVNFSNSDESGFTANNFGIKTSNLSSEGFTLSWNDFPDAISYKIYLNESMIKEVNNTQYTLDKLNPSSEYKVFIEAVNKNGNIIKSDIFKAYTKMPSEKLNADLFLSDNQNKLWTLGWSPKDNPLDFTSYKLTKTNHPYRLWFLRNSEIPHPIAILNNYSETKIASSNSQLLPKQIALAPGPESEWSIVRFKVPVKGKFSITAKFGSAQPKPSTDVHIIIKDKEVFSSKLHPSEGIGLPRANSPSEVNFRGEGILNSGDFIYFAVGDGQNDYSGDDTSLDVIIEQLE